MAWQTQKLNWGCDGTAMSAATAFTADGVVGSAINVGRGAFDIAITVASYLGGTVFDSVNVVIQANTLAATTTWTEIGNLVIGDAAGRGVALTSAAPAIVGVINQGDNQIRAYCYLNGSAASVTLTVKAYPRGTASI